MGGSCLRILVHLSDERDGLAGEVNGRNAAQSRQLLTDERESASGQKRTLLTSERPCPRLPKQSLPKSTHWR